MAQNNALAVFESKQIRRIWHNEQWYFSVVDVIEALTDSSNPRNYWNMLKIREKETSNIELYTNCVQLKLQSADGKYIMKLTVLILKLYSVLSSPFPHQKQNLLSAG